MQRSKSQFNAVSWHRMGGLAFTILVLLPACPVFAAEIFFEPEKRLGLKNQFMMNVFLNAEEPLNAIEGKIRFPPDLLELKNIEDGNSIINFWIERPVAGEAGKITFSGITPGGYQGERGLVFSLIFLVKQEGMGAFGILDAKVLRNDGKGTEAKLQAFDSQFIISKKPSIIEVPALEIKDAAPPESFVPEVARDPTVFDGRWFLVFATQDKGTGIDRYEVKETRQRTLAIFSKWVSTRSPYVLNDQELQSHVLVKAFDRAGNRRIVALPPANPLPWYRNYENWGIIITGGILTLIASKISWRKRVRNT